MPRVAERLLGSFDASKRPSRPNALEIIRIRRPDGSTQENVYRVGSRPISPRDSIVTPTGEPIQSRRMTIVETEDGNIEVSEGFVDLIQEANVDGVRHLKTSNKWVRAVWLFIILLFVILALYQIYSQVRLFMENPVATNIDAEYPAQIAFPTVAICNNNQYRLTYITDKRQMSRRPPNGGQRPMLSMRNNGSIFDQILENNWDKEAVLFLRNAAHQKYRMILGCTWPNGTACSPLNFRPVWTMTGICYAINTDVHNPVMVSGSGSGHGLKLLLNIESYERIEACTPYFKAKLQPGLKILIYNQTDIPESSLNGVNVPPGYLMDIPFKMQHRHKLSSSSCIEETDEHKKAASDDFFSKDNCRTCAIQKYVEQIEKSCDCSIRHAFAPTPAGFKIPACNVDDYFGCVERAIQKVRDSGETAKCLPPCESIDYTAWQDMNRLPINIMPPVIDEDEEEDEQDVVDEDAIDKAVQQFSSKGTVASSKEEKTEFFVCDDSEQLPEKTVKTITRVAKHAFEKQSRFQDDIHLKTKRLIAKLMLAKNRLISDEWGWKKEEFQSVYDRLNASCPCFTSLREKHSEIILALNNPPPSGEEKRSHQLHLLLDENDYQRQPERFKSIGDVKATYGDTVETMLKHISLVADYIEKLWAIFLEKNYHMNMDADLSRMDRIFELMSQYDHGKLHRKTWADKMQSRQMRHFFEEEFYDNWYQPIHGDLQQKLQKVLSDAEQNDWKKIEEDVKDGFVEKIGSVVYFAQVNQQNTTRFKDFLIDLRQCVNEEINGTSFTLLNDFKKRYKEFQSAYNNLFKKELPDYLENFDFDKKFESDNFAMVNIYLHKMHLEHWRQDRTYTFWSLACDIGGALGLFLGASLLTLIELVYLCFHYGIFHEGLRKVKRNTWVRKLTNAGPPTPILSKHSKDPVPRSGRNSFAVKSNGTTPKKSSVWSNPMVEADLEAGLGTPSKISWNDGAKHHRGSYDPDSGFPTMDSLAHTPPVPKQFSVIREETPQAENSSPKGSLRNENLGNKGDSPKSFGREGGPPEQPHRFTLAVAPPPGSSKPQPMRVDHDEEIPWSDAQEGSSSSDDSITASVSKPTLFHPNRHSAQPSPPKVPYLASPEDLTSPESLNNNQRREFDPDLYEDRYNDPFEIEPRVHQRAPNRQSFEEPYPEDFDDEEKEEEHERTPMLRNEYRDAISASPELESSSISESHPRLFSSQKS
ncbi:unnamed protein product, partial [Mesorhabditis belari]|uniref:Uncharacterized protein n=1 Tax=Mesorhabditis belari TaxID=2138241 RepID=A0AAF3FGH4_9BILA